MTSDKQACRVCGSEIPAGAKKCIECNEYQNPLWRWLSSKVISGLVALVPICTLAFTFVHDRLQTEASDLQYALIGCHQNAIELFASNRGNRAAIFTGAEFSTNNRAFVPLLNQLTIEEKVIAGGETRVLLLTTDEQTSPGGLVPFAQRQTAKCQVIVKLHQVTFDQIVSSQEMPCACPAY